MRQYRPDDINNAISDATLPLGRNDILRTGTGSIEIAAAGDVEIVNPTSAIYTAGVAIDGTTIPGFVDLPPQLPALRYRSRRPAGSSDHRPVDQSRRSSASSATAPALPTMGGDIRISAGGDVIGQQNITDMSGRLTSSRVRPERPALPATSARYSVRGSSTRVLPAKPPTSRASSAERARDFDTLSTIAARQTASWVVTGTFQQGTAALGGGDLTVRAGGGVRDASFSVVSTYAVGGGKSAGQRPAMHRFGGGNLTRRCRRRHRQQHPLRRQRHRRHSQRRRVDQQLQLADDRHPSRE